MIYVAGSINMDISAALGKMPKAGETVIAESAAVGLGGKGANQAVAVSRLGGNCAMIGKVGCDSNGSAMREGLKAAGVDISCVTECDTQSGTALIWVHRGNNRIAVIPGANSMLGRKDIDAGLQKAKTGDVLMLQLEVPTDTVTYALKVAGRKGMVTILNPAPAAPLSREIYENSEIIAPNETETKILTGINPDCEVNIALAVKKFRELGARNVIITLGSKGSAVAVGQEITLVPAVKVKAVDTTAAGDTYLGAVALKLDSGEDLVSAAKFATYASALKVTRRGASAAIPSASEVDEFIQEKLRSQNA